jgi:single-strand DNA-binding protein
MGFVNKVMLLGNTTRDPELRTLASGTVVCDFGIATNRVYKTANGEEKQETAFVDCTAFGRTAEVIAEYAPKGRSIFIEGRLHFESWEDKNGNRRNKLSVIVESVQFVGSRDGGGGDGGQRDLLMGNAGRDSRGGREVVVNGAQRAAAKNGVANGAAKSRGADRFENGQRPENGSQSNLRAKKRVDAKVAEEKSVDQMAEKEQMLEDAELPF